MTNTELNILEKLELELEEAMGTANTEEESEKIQAEFEKKISTAMEELDAEFEAQIQSEEKALEEEQKESESAIEQQEEDEVIDAIINAPVEEEKENPFTILQERVTVLEWIVQEIQKSLEPKLLKISEIKKLREAELVEYANSLGIEASVRDRKKDTLKKVLDFIS